MDPTTPEVRALTADDADAVFAFFAEMSARDRTFFFQDVDDPAVAQEWAADRRRTTRAALDDGRILGFGALRPGRDWSSHVVDLSVIVAPSSRREGLGKMLARGMLLEALQQDFAKVTVMIPADNHGAIRMFSQLGFEGEALLRGHLRSPQDGALHDVAILAHLVEETWASMLTGGLQGVAHD